MQEKERVKLKSVRIKNFRGYKDEVTVDFSDLTAFAGKNDVGKFTVLEALDIFFNDNKGAIKVVKNEDINKLALLEGDAEICISACFDDIPDRIVIDSANETALFSEYLLNRNGQLEIIKKYPNTNTAKVFVNAYHPTNPSCCDLFSKRNTDLRIFIDNQGMQCANKAKSSVMCKAIWDHYRDNEVQDPLQEATKQILNDDELQQNTEHQKKMTEARGQLGAFKNGKQTISYIKMLGNGNTKSDKIILAKYIRPQIHHPENTHNTKYTSEELEQSIDLMRSFIFSSIIQAGYTQA